MFSFLVCTVATEFFVVLRKLKPLTTLDDFQRSGVELTDKYTIVNGSQLDGLFWLDHQCADAGCLQAFLKAPSAGFRHVDVESAGAKFSLGRSLHIVEED